MEKNLYHHQTERSLQNLASENRQLKKKMEILQEEAAQSKNILDFHDALEKDFFSAESLEDLTIKLINCLQIRPDIDFVSLCLSRQYLDAMLGVQGLQQLLAGAGISSKIGYFSIVDEAELQRYLGRSAKTKFEKTPQGSDRIFFSDHSDEVRSHAIIPLFMQRQLIGTLNLGSIRSRHYYSTETGPDLLDRLSAKLSIAIDNILSHHKLALQKEMLDRDIHRAAMLQRSLLPGALFQMKSFRIVSYFKPCEQLGGDFYDYLSLSPHQLAIIIADVSGHGISAALIAAMLKFSLQTDDIRKYPPDEMVARMNQRFCHLLKQGDYITLCYAVFDSELSVMNLVRAGHPYPILSRSLPEEIKELSPAGPPLGLDEKASYENMEVPLVSGDIIFFYTDGLREAVFDQGGVSDPKMFMGVFDTAGGSENFLKGLPSAMDRVVAGKELEDDISLLIVAVK